MKVLSPEQVRAVDQYTIEREPIASIDLMERAANGCFDWIIEKYSTAYQFIIFCGHGNNGGDGLAIARRLLEKGYRVDYIPVNSDGIIDLKELKRKIGKDTLMVSIMHVNNEIGTIQPIEEIGKICKRKGVYFHSDCVQSFGKLDIDVQKLDVDMISVSGHKDRKSVV